MHFTTSAIILALSALAAAMPQGANANRPVPTGACCIANTSLKEDVCNVNGQSGRCVPDDINNCKSKKLEAAAVVVEGKQTNQYEQAAQN